MLDEEAGVVGSAEEGGLTAEAEADGAEDGGFACSVGAYYYIQSGQYSVELYMELVCAPMPGKVHLTK